MNIEALLTEYKIRGIRNLKNLEAECEKILESLIEANKKFNLTRITDKKDFYLKHIFDSLAIYKAFPDISKGGFNICDIGCGAGFPLLPLALAYPENTYTGFESRNKKVTFVQEEILKLNIKNCKCIHSRAATAGLKPTFKYHFDIITARAVASLSKLFFESENLLKKNGKMIFYKTPSKAESEINELLKNKPNITVNISEIFTLPDNFGERIFVTIKLNK